MTERPSREEAASIVRALRRFVERELQGPHAELLAAATRRKGARSTSHRKPVAGRVTPSVPGPRPGVFGDAPPTRRVVTHGGGTLHPAGLKARKAIAESAEAVLKKIAKEVDRCKDCALWETRTKAVPGVGSALSGVVFVGEAPGADEDRKGEPFVGRAGQLLDRIIKAMNDAKLIPGVPLSRETVFIGNVIHCRPPNNRVPAPFEVEQSSPFLKRQLEALQPRIICCLGKTAAEHLLGRKGSLASMRGQTYHLGGAKMIVTYHPAAVLRNPDLKRPVWEDMQRLAREYQMD